MRDRNDRSYMVQKDQDVPDDWISAVGTPDLVSIVIPTHNRAHLLAQTLHSIFAQDYRPIEVIVVDDDSHDETEHTVHELMEQAPADIDLTYHKQAKAGGPAARNCGARRSTGEFMVFMDDDDVFGTKFVSSHVKTLRANGHAEVSYCKWQRFVVQDSQYAMLEIFGEHPPDAQSPWQSFLLRWSVLLQGCMLRRSTVKAVGPWRPELLKSQDLDYKARLFAEVNRVAEAPDARIFYRIHQASVSGQFDGGRLDSYCRVLDDIEQLACQRGDYETIRPLLADYLWSHAYWLTTQGATKPALKTLHMAKRHDPSVALRNGPRLARVLSRCGLDSFSGPLLYGLFRARVALFGKPPLPIRGHVDELPEEYVN